jgi:ketosteroid isomerase-like protein
MRKIIVALAVAVLASGTAVASDKTDVMAVVHQFADGFNKGDVKSALATCADNVVIIDDFSPHVWDGAGACAKWASDFDADSKKTQTTEAVVTMGRPRHLDVMGDRAYVVLPTGYTYKVAGKPMQSTGCVWTLALQKTGAGWRITGWAWAGGKESPVTTQATH